MQRQTLEHEKKKAEENLARKRHQEDLLMQMSEKDRLKRREVQEKMYEERAAKLAEIDYQKKIQQTKSMNQTKLSDMMSQRPFA